MPPDKQNGPGVITPQPAPNAKTPATRSKPIVQPAGDVPAQIRRRRDRPLCRVVGAYCEALYWLQREPLSRATACCRHYWGEREAS
jgi:hypothetical protein